MRADSSSNPPDRTEHVATQNVRGETALAETAALLQDALRHHRDGRLHEAAGIYRRILAIDGGQADSLHLLGMIAFRAGGHDLAAAMIRRAIAIDKKKSPYHCNLGTVLHAQGKLDEAAACCERALTLNPESGEIHLNLGNLLQEQGKLDEALACYKCALALQPELAEAHQGMGNVLQSRRPDQLEGELQDQLDEAVTCYDRALAIKPNYAEAHYNLGCALRALGRADEALAHYRMALAFKPDYIAAGLRQSLTQLLKGDFRAGWRDYERRWHSKDHGTPMRSYPQPLWTGEKLTSGRLLIWREQGIGDEIMFAGLVPDVLRTGNRCILECDARLRPLFARSFPSVEVVSSHDASKNDARENNNPNNDPNYDPKTGIAAHLPSGSLPGLFRRTSASFAATTSPYLVADALQRDRFRARYATEPRQRLVGLAWYTSNCKTGRYRSMDLSLFAPLFARPGIRRSDIQWISLQYGNHDALHGQAAAAGAPILIDRSVDQFADIDLFAAQVAAMDLVITIDNSTAHLAGALGVPTWVLLPFAPDWRWLEARNDSPWYPTLRLFRQIKRGDWQSAVERVASAL